MQLQARAGSQEVSFNGEGAGEGLAIFVSQDTNAVGRYRIVVKAITDQTTYTVGEIFVSPPTATDPHGLTSRMVAAAVCPGVTGWTVQVRCMNAEIPDETLDIILTSSKCCTAPVGCTRVGERYLYHSGAASASTVYSVLPGQKILSWGVLSPSVAGSVTLGTGDTIPVPAGAGVSGEPRSALLIAESFTFVNVDWFIELAESA